MVSTIAKRPTHYDTLGLEPTASDEDITRAFARQMQMFRPMAESARIGIAFETLRDPAKRRAYDERLGLRQAPKPAEAVPEWAAFLVRASARPGEQPPARKTPRPAVPEPVRSVAPRETARPPVPQAEPLRGPEPSRPHGALEPAQAPGEVDADAFHDVETGSIAWKPAAMAAGAVLLAAGVLGAWAGVSVGNSQQAAQPGRAVTLALPKAKAVAENTDAVPVEARRFADMRLAPPRQHSATRRRPGNELPAVLAEPQVPSSESVASPAERSSFVDTATEQAQAVAEAAPIAAGASLPLSHGTVARTISRIGYSCGQVASAIETAPGVFKVTCTSGQSYRAAPVGGRYHFRRWSGK